MSNITHYELTTIVDSNIPDNKHPEIIDKMKKLISDNKGEISSEENLGRKKLSYPIKKLLKGVFVCIEFNIEPKTIKSIEKELKLDKNIIRYIIIKKPKNVTPINPKKNNKEKEENIKDKFKTLDEIIEKKLSTEKPIKETNKETEEKKSSEKYDKKDGETSLNDLDKKLDEILSNEI